MFLIIKQGKLLHSFLATRSTEAHIEESRKHDENVVSYTTNVLELKSPELHWHISRLPYMSKEEC